MQTIARTLILAVQYIADRVNDSTEEDDVKQLEQAAHSLAGATQAEKELLVNVAMDLGFPEWPKQIGITE
ncbi:MAG: hypothetical protein HZA46_14225 [Planctomycetales bacterium]|nr:hypothetical protein [Planctomycetales bacterium]